MKLALKVPPPVVLLIFGILMWFVGSRLPGGQFEIANQMISAISVGVLGLIINISAIIGLLAVMIDGVDTWWKVRRVKQEFRRLQYDA